MILAKKQNWVEETQKHFLLKPEMLESRSKAQKTQIIA